MAISYMNVRSYRTPLEPILQKVHHVWVPHYLAHVMKALSVFLLLILCAGCADIPELEGSEAPAVKSAPYPSLIPLTEVNVPPVDPLNEAAVVEEELAQRAEQLSQKAKALQNVATD